MIQSVPDRPLVPDPIKALLEYPYELGVWDFYPVHILILLKSRSQETFDIVAVIRESVIRVLES
jgi:hypothetical protein